MTEDLSKGMTCSVRRHVAGGIMISFELAEYRFHDTPVNATIQTLCLTKETARGLATAIDEILKRSENE